MRTAQEMYPGYVEPFYAPADYGPMLASIGTVVVSVDDVDYQGDSRVLYRDGARWGVLLFGWGSCSGCDSLQACQTYKEIEALRDGLAAGVRWGTAEETRLYLATKDWEGTATWNEKGPTERFVRECLEALDQAGSR